MRPEKEPNGQSRSFIEEARRAQIIAAAIGTIAEVGYPNASLARIARTAGISKGVISYHFAGKDELMDQVVTNVYTEITESVVPGVLEQASAADMLRAHVRGVAEYALANPERMTTLKQIFTHARKADGSPRYGAAESDALYESLEGLYRGGQESGELRDFDVRVMAVTQQSAIDTMFAYWDAHPGHDLMAHARELGELLVRATRADQPPLPPPSPE
ncbi:MULTISPECIES: TetR/AcrR family transcriptional regulator [Nocardiopsis]|uniref:TetR family transcriptional regulator n=1 Tax=Nocardiopsis sinuspersici TaxID=501010 RepID=A0A1V3C0N3_9ACTN|nr:MULTISPECIES: TetR/AcrR family transcriptional regulator [Nocardiopsis]OOC53920.1 TetR family transcriptional regulator [Nocardiopsis sinuspersici]